MMDETFTFQQSIKLPSNWAWATLGEICFAPQYGWTTRASSHGHVKLLRTTDITSGSINWASVPFCEKEPDDIEKYSLNDGDIVISRAGSVGFSILLNNPEKSVFASYLIRFQPYSSIYNKYLAYYLMSPAYWESISEKSLGIAVPNVNASKLKQVAFPLAPLPEQYRIVAKIEELFSQLDVAEAALKRAKNNLERYRRSVLQAAVTGELTQSDLSEEPSEMILSRLGKTPISPEGPPSLPVGWCWTKMDDIADTIGGITKGRDLSNKSIIKMPYLRVANVQRGKLDLDELKEIEVLVSEINKYVLYFGDVLLTEGGDWDKLGRSAIWRNQVPACVHQNHIFRARVKNHEIMPEWISFYTNSESGKRYFQEAAKQTTNLASINLTQLRACPIPLPPLAEQKRIALEVERQISMAAEIGSILDVVLKRVERIRQSILQRAFQGRLVEQDPRDEPASVLLQRIQAQREARQKAPTPKEQP